MATLMVEVPDDEVWSAVFGSAFESYPWWVSVRFLDDADWDKPGSVRVEVDDPDSPEFDGKTRVLVFGIETLVEAINKCRDKGITDSRGPDYYDANDGDCIVQMAMLGDVVYG